MMASVSRRNFKDMTMCELKAFLRERGVTVMSHLKPALVEIAIAVEKMMLPTDPNFERASNTDHKLIIHDMEIEDPLSGSFHCVNNFVDSPPFGLYDIFNHLIYHSTEYDKQGLAAYKSFDDYRLFEGGYVESLLTETLTNEGVHLYIGKVRPAMKEKTDEGKKFYDLWFILEGKGANRGSVLKARCICKGGRDGGCKHIAAAMYSLESLLNSRGEESVTSGSCQWVKRPTADSKPTEVKYLKIGKRISPLKMKGNNKAVPVKRKEMTFRRSNHSSKAKKKRKISHVYCENIDLDVRKEEDKNTPTQEALAQFTQSLSGKVVPKPPVLIHLLEKLYLPNKEDGSPECSNKVNHVGIMKRKLCEYTTKGGDNGVIADVGKEVLFSREEVESVNIATVKQWRCREWYIEKAGFISASKAKRIIGIQNSLEKGQEKDVSKVVEEIVNPSVPPHLPSLPDQPENPRAWGLRHEDSARRAYYKVESKYHDKLKLLSKGFMISIRKPFVGASVDNIRACECEEDCPAAVVEYKCPWKHRELPPKEAFLTPEIGGQQLGDTFSLKTNSSYYCQVQLQMFVYNLTLCYLVVWTKLGVLTVQVPFDQVFTQSMVDKIQEFWIAHVLPKMILQVVGLKCEKDVKTQAGTNAHTEEKVTKLDVSCLKSNQHHQDKASPKKILHSTSVMPTFISVSGVNIFESCINGLLPCTMLNDNIVEFLIGEENCHFPVLSSFFYTVLCGEQESKRRCSRNERNTKAEVFFKPGIWSEDFIFIPINRSYHWLLAVITPWHVIIMDSLTWDISTRRTEFSLIFSFLTHLTEKFSLPKKHLQLKYKVLKVPQQEVCSNNCGIICGKVS